MDKVIKISKETGKMVKKVAKQLTDVEVHSPEREYSLYGLDSSVDMIEERLYLGNLACARDVNELTRLKVTHILTVDLVPLPRTILNHPRFNFYYLHLADVPKEDLISHLPTTNKFIQDALSEGGTVLVHCVFGVSRSASLVIAYIMEKYKLDYEDAFSLVKSKRFYVHPNDGFVAQLKLWGHMNYSLNKDDPRFKQFRLKLAGQKLRDVKILPQLFADLIKPDPGLIRERPEPIVYRCKKCRRIVASQNNIIPHILKILPQLFADLIKPDPGLIRERPEPIVYRCKKCRRIVASQNNIIPHIPKPVKVEMMKKNLRPQPSKSGLETAGGASGNVLIEKLNSLASQIDTMISLTDSNVVLTEKDAEAVLASALTQAESTSQEAGETSQAAAATNQEPAENIETETDNEDIDSEYSEQLVDSSVVSRDVAQRCTLMWFVEPMAWMRDVQHAAHGKLYCPKCQVKIGSFSWTMGCKCPCGQKVAPAFYLVPSKVEWSNIVQNVQETV